MRGLIDKTRMIVVSSILIIIFLSLAVLALNLKSRIIYANMKDQESFNKQLLTVEQSNRIEK
jgi:hypothetical protein